MGQKPVTFIRQMTSQILNNSETKVPKDVKDRADQLLKGLPGQSVGVYSGVCGVPLVRQDIAEYITRRDGGIPSDPDNIICSNGASGAVMTILSLFANEEEGLKCGVLTPVPQYPLYQDAISSFGLHQVNYYLDEKQAWGLSIPDLQKVTEMAKAVCKPKVIVVINPGNPTGQVLTRKCIEEIIKFAYRERLFICADEVYQLNVCQEEVPFQSFKKVMCEMGQPYCGMELASFMSVSKGYAGECGLRGGYVELFNPCPKVRQMLNTVLQTQLCPSAMGQVAMDCVVREPVAGDESYELFRKEKNEILDSLRRRSEIISKALNQFKGVTCNPVMGAMYAYPRLHLPDKAIAAANQKKLEPDGFYVMELLEATGELSSCLMY